MYEMEQIILKHLRWLVYAVGRMVDQQLHRLASRYHQRLVHHARRHDDHHRHEDD